MREIANIKGQALATGPGDGSPRQVAIAARRETVHRLAVDGWGMRQIARELGVAPATVHADLQAILAEDAARKPLQADELRAVIGARLDDSRRALVSIARGEPQPIGGKHTMQLGPDGKPKPIAVQVPTVQERISAHGRLAAIEEQRAKLYGITAKGAAGDLAEWLLELAKAGAETAAEQAQAQQVRLDSAAAAAIDSTRREGQVGHATPWLPPPPLSPST